MSKVQFTRKSKGSLETLFDWRKVEKPEQIYDSANALELIRQACESHTIGRVPFGLDMKPLPREGDEPLKGTYHAKEITDPVGALLDGHSFRVGMMADAARILNVDEYWLVGFLHGFDGVDESLIGRKKKVLEESENYLNGVEAGRDIATEFLQSGD